MLLEIVSQVLKLSYQTCQGLLVQNSFLASVSPAHLFLRRGKDVRESKRDELGGMIMIEVRAADLVLPRE